MNQVLIKSVHDPWRGWISLRRFRLWVKAILFQRRHNRRVPADAPTINFYPMRPGPKSSMAVVLPRVPARIGHSPEGGALRIAWDTGTGFRSGNARRLSPDAINRRCLDISKSTVDGLWASLAGYSIAVDPLTTEGEFVEKPEQNGRHGGRVVQGPLTRRRRGMVYQKLVESLADDGRIQQLRVTIIGSQITFIYGKWRPYGNWFEGTELSLPKPPDEYISPKEQALVLRFADGIGIEYGELDALRDRDGRLYVIDANRTPAQPKGLPPEMADAAFGTQADAIRRLIEA